MRELGDEDALGAGYTFVRTHDRERQYVELVPRVRIAHPGHDLRQGPPALHPAGGDTVSSFGCHESLREAARIPSRSDSTLWAPKARPRARVSSSKPGRSGPRSRRTF